VRIDTSSKRMIFAVTISDKRVIKTMNRLIHPSAWNRNSQKFAVAISPSTPHSDGYRGVERLMYAYTGAKHLSAAGNIHNFAYLSIGVTSSSGREAERGA
jgi:hypothetical protein